MVTKIWVSNGSGKWLGAITWTNVDFSSVRFCGIHLRAISHWVTKPLCCILSLKIILLKLLHLPGDNELTQWGILCHFQEHHLLSGGSRQQWSALPMKFNDFSRTFQQCRWKTCMVHQTFVWWALYIPYKFVKSSIRHFGLAIGNVRCVRRFFAYTVSRTSLSSNGGNYPGKK